MPELQKDQNNVKNNLLPFPVEYMPKDPPRASGWQVLMTLIVIAGAIALLWLTISALID